jgi:hypothetical protein
MKNTILLLLTVFVSTIYAETEQIIIKASVQEGDKTLAAPSVTVIQGKEAEISVTQDFTQGAHLSLPVGVTMKSLVEMKEGKISYSIALAIREQVESSGDLASKVISTFRTRELLLSGMTAPEKEVKAQIDAQTLLTLSFELSPSD